LATGMDPKVTKNTKKHERVEEGNGFTEVENVPRGGNWGPKKKKNVCKKKAYTLRQLTTLGNRKNIMDLKSKGPKRSEDDCKRGGLRKTKLHRPRHGGPPEQSSKRRDGRAKGQPEASNQSAPCGKGSRQGNEPDRGKNTLATD